ncbi:hypothetical protein ACFOLC_06920 [Lysobacter cavernae]|uniref:Type 1 fimbrial protein n=1 Tax=Lysobacter cavernae TaxID=1685901 RepID=A0ABV7RPG8_9GAMM
MGRLGATAGILLWALAVSPAAQANDGRISFHGSVVVPTCGPALGVPAARALPHSTQARCPDTSASTHYSLRVEPAASALPGSQLISYHDNYLRAAGTSAWLATQVYD